MRTSIKLGRIGGLPIGAHWSVLVILAIVADLLATSILPATVKGASTTAYWTTGVVVAAAFLLSLVAHETAHAIVARRAGITVTSITLWMLGGVTVLDGDPPDARSDLRIAVVGPAVSVVAGLFSGGAALVLQALGAPRVLVAGSLWLCVTNGLLAVFNLLPGAPLDGGRVLRALVWRRTGDRNRAELAATRGGRMTGFILLWLGITEALTMDILGGLWLMLIGWFLISSATAEQRAAVTEAALHGLTVDQAMQTSFTWLPAYYDVAPAARLAVQADEEYFPVCDVDGRPVAIVGVDRLVQAVNDPRPLKVNDVAVTLTSRTCVTRDELLVAALARAGRDGLLAVLEQGHVVGIVTPLSVKRAVRRGVVGLPQTEKVMA